jgi:signal peptidase
VSGAFLLLVIALGVLVLVVPKVVGGIPLTVLTSSMIPHFPPGTLVIDRPVDPADLKVGDVATYQIESGQPGVITHRIIAIRSSTDGTRSFQFKGDNNSVPDGKEVVQAQIRGKVWYSIPLLGYVNNAVNGPTRSAIIPIVASLLFAYAGYTIASAIVGARRARRSLNRPAVADPGGIIAD